MKIITLLLLALSGCATPYQSDGARGGYTDLQIAPDAWIVTFSGNGYTGLESVQNFALRRCAELAIEKGYTHFVVNEGGQNTDTSLAQGFNYNTQVVSKHSARMAIRLFKEPHPAGALEAKIVLANFKD